MPPGHRDPRLHGDQSDLRRCPGAKRHSRQGTGCPVSWLHSPTPLLLLNHRKVRGAHLRGVVRVSSAVWGDPEQRSPEQSSPKPRGWGAPNLAFYVTFISSGGIQ